MAPLPPAPIPPALHGLRDAFSSRVFRLWIVLFAVLAVAGISFGVLFRSARQWASLPDCPDRSCPVLDEARDFRPYEPPLLLDRDERLVAFLPGRVSVHVDLDRVSPWVVDGVVAVEDRRFHGHRGIDYRAILRAALRNVGAGGTREGASTITMQLVRVLWADGLRSHSKWRRKAIELRAARALERRLEKDEILELYLNNVYFGNGVYGIEAAARQYFGKPASDLPLAEAAALIGAIKTPSVYNPRGGDRARERRDLVLHVLEDAGIAPALLAAAARRQDLGPVQGSPHHQASSYFAATVDQELRRLIPEPARRSGVRVFTTLDRTAQASAEARLIEQIEAIEAGDLGAFEPPPAPSDTVAAAGLQGAVVVLDMESGAVRAVVGGRSFDGSRFNRAFHARRQPGSAFKPFVFGAALEAGTLTLADRIDLTPLEVETDEGLWQPRDMVDDTTGMPAREAMALSSNTAAVRIGMEAGLANVRRFSQKVGLASGIAPYPSSFLGASEMTPVELASAYATFGNGGRLVDPHIILRVEAQDGSVLYEREEEAPARAIGADLAYLIHTLLSDVVNRGTGYSVRRAGYWGPAAGKTGTTNGGRDAWFVGYNGAVSTAVWIGFDEPRSIARNANGSHLAAPIWARIMSDVFGTTGPRHWWGAPASLTSARVDGSLGLRVPDGCSSDRPTRDEYFLEGTEPSVFCPELDRPDALELLITEPIAVPGRKKSGS